jgi:hypothetical protein
LFLGISADVERRLALVLLKLNKTIRTQHWRAAMARRKPKLTIVGSPPSGSEPPPSSPGARLWDRLLRDTISAALAIAKC